MGLWHGSRVVSVDCPFTHDGGPHLSRHRHLHWLQHCCGEGCIDRGWAVLIHPWRLLSREEKFQSKTHSRFLSITFVSSPSQESRSNLSEVWEGNPVRGTLSPFSPGLPACREQPLTSAAPPERPAVPRVRLRQDGRPRGPLRDPAPFQTRSQHLASPGGSVKVCVHSHLAPCANQAQSRPLWREGLEPGGPKSLLAQ